MPAVIGRQYLVGDYVIDTARYRISSVGAAVPVEPKVFDLLVYLIRNRDRVVTREELFETVWDGRAVSDATLSNHVKSARKVLGDSGELQRTIQTIRGRGYQFIAPVSEVAGGADDPANSSVPAPSAVPASRHGKPLWRMGLAATLLVIAGAVFAWRYLGVADTPPHVEDPRLLVVPLDVYRAEPETWQPWADELTRRLVTNLQQVSGLQTLGRATSFMFVDKDKKTHEYIHEKLPDVRYALGGMLDFSADNKPTVTMELHDLSTGKLIWTQSYAYPHHADDEDRARLQLIITRAVSTPLQVTILEDEGRALERLGKSPTQNSEAMDLYVRGWKYLLLPEYESLKKAIGLFDRAIALDANFYDAHLAKGKALRYIYGYYETPKDVFPHVVEAFEKARALRRDAAEPLSELGFTYALAWQWTKAWENLDAARQRNPNLATTELGLAIYYSGLNEVEKVKSSLERARKIDPLDVELADWGNWSLFLSNEIAASRAWGIEMMEKHPSVGFIFTDAAIGAYMGKEYERAIELATHGQSLENSPLAMIVAAQAFGYAGQAGKARPLLEEAAKSEYYACPYESAVGYLSIGDTARAMQLLEVAYQKLSNCLVFLRFDPRLAPIRKDPYRKAYLDLLARVGLDDEKFNSYPR
jgi:DNA-binding winged helix-turn-helix (wHTH) protein/TolB-like protein/tetratricopeptide (TPR) repeat protein